MKALLGAVVVVVVVASAEASANDVQINCLALNIYHEARGEPIAGQIAVAQVVMNRVQLDEWPSTPCKVIRQKRVRHICQFSWYCDGRSDKPDDFESWRLALILARLVFTGAVHAEGVDAATCYHAEYIPYPWRERFPETAKIGRHIFYNCYQGEGKYANSSRSRF